MNVKTFLNQTTFSKGLLRAVVSVLLITWIGISSEAYAADARQSFKVSGLVTDKNGEPIIAANVFEPGTQNAATTDVDGKYAITVSGPQATISISYIGYSTQTVPVSGRGYIETVLLEDQQYLDELVVIGYGSQKKSDVTSSVASVKSESFNKGAILDAGQLVQGKVAGLQISLPNGDPTASTAVMLRGTSSLKGSTTPLILVDGVPGSFSTVAAEDIESIDVLKDGSATAIYGTRGTNGVIIITTKSSRRDMPTTIEYNGYVSISHQLKKADFMSAEDLRSRWAEGWSFSGANDQDYGASVNWLDEVSRTGIANVHNVTLRGGSSQTSVLANIAYEDREGTFKASGATNLRGRMEISHRMFDNKLITNVSMIANERTTTPSFNTNVYRYACIQNPTQPIYNEDGTYVERPVYFYDNPVSLINETIGEGRARNLRFTGSVEFRPVESFAVKAMYTRKGQSYLSGYYNTKKHPNTTESGYNGYASRYTSDYINNLAEITAEWNENFGKHYVTAILGYNYEDNTSENYVVSNRNFPTDAYTYNNLETGMGLTDGNATMYSYKESDKLIGIFARATYNYYDRYLLMVSVRREGSSKFGANHKLGTFPGVSLGWRLYNESFMKDITWLDNLKVRAGYGVTGINVGDPYLSLSSLSYSGYFLYNNEWISTLTPVRNPNAELRWEKKLEYNFGLDFDMFGGRLGGAIDVYRRDTKDGLWDYSVPVPPYLYGSITANVAQIRNTGVEVAINAVPVRTKNMEWSSNLSYSTNKNELVSISNDQFSMSTDWFTTGHTGEPIQTTTHRVKVGDPVGNFYGLKSVGLSTEGKWVVERLQKDAEGNVTGVYYDLAADAGDEDWQVLGNGVPKHYLNWNNYFRYKNLDFSVTMRGAFGFQILNYQEMYYANPTIQYNVLNSAFDKHPVVDLTTGQPTGQEVVINDSPRYVSQYIEDGDYWKIDNLTLGYSFNTAKKIKFIRNIRVYGSCANLFTFTNYTGLDPEVRMTGLDAGTDSRDKYPTIRSYTFGLNITF